MCSRPFRPLGFPIYVARVPAAPFTRSYARHFYVDHSHCLVLAPATLAALPSTRAIETRSLPSSLAATHRGFAFYVAFPKSSIPWIATCSMSLIPFAPFGRCNGKRTNVRCARSRSQCLTLQAACVAGKTSHSDVATAIGRTQPIRPIRLRSGQDFRSRLRTTSTWQAGQAHWRLQDSH